MDTMANPATQITLLERLSDHSDSEAWSTFVAIYQPLMRRLLDRWGVSGADADEVTQEVLAAVSQAIKGYRPGQRPGSFRSWLSSITRHKMIDLLRKKDRFPQPIGGTDFQQWLGELAHDQACDRWELERRRELFQWAAQQVRHQVQARTWQAFEQTTVYGKPAADVAAELQASIGWVYVGMQWGDRAIMIGSSVSCTAIAMNLVNTLT